MRRAPIAKWSDNNLVSKTTALEEQLNAANQPLQDAAAIEGLRHEFDGLNAARW
jgi:hypothetical protein